MLLGLALMLYLYFGNMGGTSYMKQVQKSKANAEAEVRQISTDQLCILISMYRDQNNKLPTSPADIDSPGAFNDPWGKEMTFSFERKDGKTIAKFLSAGKDGEFKTEDDKVYEGALPY